MRPPFRDAVVKDMEARLKTTRARKQLDKIKFDLDVTSRRVKASDEVPMPEDGGYYDRLHAKILAAVFVEDASLDWMPIFAGTLFYPLAAKKF